MADISDALLVDRNLREAMSFYAGVNEESRIHSLPGVIAIFCGRNYPVFNIALLETRRPGDLKTEINAATAHYRNLHSGFCFWMCHDLVEPRLLAEIRNTVFPAKGFSKLSEPPGMLLTGPPPSPKRKPSALIFKKVEDAASRISFSHLTSVIFEIPFGITQAMYASAAGWTEEYEGWIVFENNTPVALALIVFSPGAAGFYSIGVLPNLRKKGIGEATLRWCIKRAQQVQGRDRFVLQSSDAGLPLYKRMGFKEVTRFSVFKSREN